MLPGRQKTGLGLGGGPPSPNQQQVWGLGLPLLPRWGSFFFSSLRREEGVSLGRGG